MDNILILQKIILDVFVDIFYFPVWWFGKGLKKITAYCYDMVSFANSYLAPTLWLKNIFVPMFGQRDFQGKIMSFFIRFANVIIRSVMLVFLVWVISLVAFLWIVFPFFVFYLFSKSLGLF